MGQLESRKNTRCRQVKRAVKKPWRVELWIELNATRTVLIEGVEKVIKKRKGTRLKEKIQGCKLTVSWRNLFCKFKGCHNGWKGEWGWLEGSQLKTCCWGSRRRGKKWQPSGLKGWLIGVGKGEGVALGKGNQYDHSPSGIVHDQIEKLRLDQLAIVVRDEILEGVFVSLKTLAFVTPGFEASS